ncbi:MAG: family 43 glycosylhydrolase [Paludibacter sp.]
MGWSKNINNNRYDAIHSGTPWFDQNNREVNAHGACIVEEGNKYYLFGEYKSDTANVFTGFSCYSSTDLMNWKFERIVLPVQKDGLMGPNRVGERVKVMKCPLTGEFVMYMHSDNLLYKDPTIGYATCKTINGEYQFKGALLFDGKPIRRWDMGTFQDTDGKGYLLIHHGFIYELSGDYKSIKRLVINQKQGGEAPAIFKSKGIYCWLSSNLSSWEKNDNMYLTATSLEGPWTFRGLFVPQGSLTWNSQTTFVLPVTYKTDTVWIFMGDRWSFPKQGSAATYVWQPIRIDTGKVFLPEYIENWTLNVSKATFKESRLVAKSIFKEKIFLKQGNWIHENGFLKSNEKDAMLTFNFKGKKIGIKVLTNATSGYARITILDSKQKTVLTSVVDCYSKNETHTQVFVSPALKNDNYTLKIQVLGEHGSWTDKSKAIFGSTDNFVVLEDVYVL